MRDWQRDAPLFIADAVKDLPPDATLKQRRAALRKVAIDFHGGTSWGRKVWSRYTRAYLEEHGLAPLARVAPSRASSRHQAKVLGRQMKRIDAPDITYPFREASHGV